MDDRGLISSPARIAAHRVTRRRLIFWLVFWLALEASALGQISGGRRSVTLSSHPGARAQGAPADRAEAQSQTTAPLDPHELHKQLDAASIDPSQVYALRNAQIARDRVKVYFNRGFVGFLTPVAGEITGAVFSGDGEVLLIPPNPVEKRNLAQFTQSPILEERFSSAYLRFTDRTARELLAVAERPDPDAVEQPTGFVERWDPVVHGLNGGHSIRILQDLLGARDLPYFYAQIQGVNLGVFEVRDDERQPEAVSVGAARGSPGRVFTDIWCSFPSRSSESRAPSLTLGPARVRSYKIDTRINSDNSLDGGAELELESLSSADRLLILELSHRLKVSTVSQVTPARVEDVSFLQSPSLEELREAERGNDWVVAVLPAPHPAGKTFRLNLTYRGNVIADAGNSVLYVGAHGSWYPNLDLKAPASFDLTFHYPDRWTLVATGQRLEETSAGGWKQSRWVSDRPFRVAGFNLGAYDARVFRAGDTRIEVYATPEAEASLEKRHRRIESQDSVEIQESPGVVVVVPKQAAPLAPAALLEDVSDRAARAVRYFGTLFGPFPYPRLAVTQIPGSFGQGWPELVYLPTLSFLPSSTRSELAGKDSELEDQLFVAHEIAHQWWGNEVGWKTYRDQWLSEGFASYAAALELLLEKGGDTKFRELLRRYKRDLLSKTKEGGTVESGGPIWLGQRLSNSLNPNGYDAIVYKKACWVLHMLRMLMADSDPAGARGRQPGSVPRHADALARPDERFFQALRDFARAYREGSPSTEDFRRYAEKFITPTANLEHNRSLDWFFADWVLGTGIPSYKLNVSTRRVAPSKFVVEGSIEQTDVPSSFEMLVPLVAIDGKGRKAALGRVAVSESGGRFRFTTSARPPHVAIDEDKVLAVVR